MSLQVGCRVRVTPNCRAARLAGRTGAVVGLGRQVELKLDGDDHQVPPQGLQGSRPPLPALTSSPDPNPDPDPDP